MKIKIDNLLIDIPLLSGKVAVNGHFDIDNTTRMDGTEMTTITGDIKIETELPIVPDDWSNVSSAINPDLSIDELEMTIRTTNALHASGIHSVGELQKQQRRDLLRLRNFGKKSYGEVKETLKNWGLEFNAN